MANTNGTGDTNGDGNGSTGDGEILSGLVSDANSDGNRNGNGNDHGSGGMLSGSGNGNSDGENDIGIGDGNGAGSGNFGGSGDNGGTNTTVTSVSKSDSAIGEQRPDGKDQDTLEERRVLIIGKRGSGKATIANHIVGMNIFEVSKSVEGLTRTNKRHRYRYHRTQIKQSYCIQLVDTIGLSDKPRHQEMVDVIKEFLTKHCQDGIHLVLFVFKNARFTREDREPINFLLDTFGQEISPISALVVTCCEGLEESSRQELCDDFRTGDSTRQVVQRMGMGVCSVGFPNLDTVKAELIETYEAGMKADEKMLRNLVANCKHKKLPLDKFGKLYQDRKQDCVIS